MEHIVSKRGATLRPCAGILLLGPLSLACVSSTHSNPNPADTVPDDSSSAGSSGSRANSAFEILGITGHLDATVDAYFTGDQQTTVNWVAKAQHTSYEVTLLDADGTTVRCPATAQPAPASSYTYVNCRGSLRALQVYWVVVVAQDAAGTATPATNSPFAFTFNATAAAASTSIVGTSPVVANGLATSTVTITLQNSAAVPLEGIVPTFAATNNGNTNIYGPCASSNTQGISTCALSSLVAQTKTLTLLSPIVVTGGPVLFEPGPAAHLYFSAGAPTTVHVNRCSPAFALEYVDAHGNEHASPGQPMELTVAHNGAGRAQFFMDAECATAPITSLPVSAGETPTKFHFKSDTRAAVTLTVSHPSLGDATQKVMLLDTPVNTWVSMSQVDQPLGRVGHTAVWTGWEMVVWGGVDWSQPGGTVAPQDGAMYSPLLDTWTPIVGVGGGYLEASAVWATTTGEVIMWGGHLDGQASNDGARFNPVTNTWRNITALRGPSPRAYHSAVWTGEEMVIWGGVPGSNGDCCALGNGAKYNPVTDTWTPVSADGAPRPRWSHTAVWTGSTMVVWGGRAAYADAPSGALYVPVFADGAAYDPASNTWESIEGHGAPSARAVHNAAWTGDQMLVWGGGVNGGDDFSDGGLYNVAGRAWSPMTGTNAPNSPMFKNGTAWTGSSLLVWNGSGGAEYVLATDTWRPFQDGSMPADDRSYHTAVWDGVQLLIWGGMAGDQTPLTTGYIFTPQP